MAARARRDAGRGRGRPRHAAHEEVSHGHGSHRLACSSVLPSSTPNLCVTPSHGGQAVALAGGLWRLVPAVPGLCGGAGSLRSLGAVRILAVGLGRSVRELRRAIDGCSVPGSDGAAVHDGARLRGAHGRHGLRGRGRDGRGGGGIAAAGRPCSPCRTCATKMPGFLAKTSWTSALETWLVSRSMA